MQRQAQRIGIGLGVAWVAVLLALPLTARAAPELYAAASPVADQSVTARVAAFGQNLAKVFVKLSGDPAAADYAATLDASSMVTEYRYNRIPLQQGGGLELWARFDAERVKSALIAAGLPLWGENRPTLMVWVATPAGIVSDTSALPLTQTLRNTAHERGLPLVLPLLDLADRQTVSAFDIRSFYLPSLQKASRRYDTQGMLIGSIKPRSGGVNSRWRLVLGGSPIDFTIESPSAQSAAAAAVNQAATELANRFARLPTNTLESALKLVVGGIESLDAAVAVRRAIGAVQGVEALRLSRVDGARLQFTVAYAGTIADFARLLELSGILTRNPDSFTPMAPAGSASQPILSFRFTP
ncbi:MAG: DUF2066 domain-containing protein [Gammaproteobacteria bacterium]|nr:DUF2066 domain-containing protein [Gammaproteobacteria bacterium]